VLRFDPTTSAGLDSRVGVIFRRTEREGSDRIAFAKEETRLSDMGQLGW